MSSSVDKSASGTQSLLTGQNIVYGGLAWSVLSLLFFLLYSVTVPGQESPLWYLLGTYILETLPFLAAALLCYRNFGSPQIASGRNVWLGIGLGMIAWFIGNLLFGWWELYWGLDPDVSPADLFYIAFYVFLSWGMVLAVLPRRLNLEIWQWITIAAIAALGIAFAVWVLFATPDASDAADKTSPPPTVEQVASKASAAKPSTAVKAPAVKPSASSRQSTTAQPVADAKPEAEKDFAKQPPGWVVSTGEALHPLSKYVNFFYIVGDVFLLIIASTLLLAFWGGRFVQSWRMIAAATFSLYIADMYSKYAFAADISYESGGLLEVFFVFSGVLFAIGAALEYDVSTSRSRRTTRKRA
ncbi:MAG TPA: hypothetical protein V6D33_20025 [Cyanophyceae cyanobacterium]